MAVGRVADRAQLGFGRGAHVLRLRAAALLSDDYLESDLAWLDLKNPKFDLIFAPYETYLDHFLGVKASFGAAVTRSLTLAVIP